MKTTIVILVVVLTLALPGKGSAQTSAVPWSTITMGFIISSSPTSILKSAVGQGFVGTMTGARSLIESGFLADTLFRTVVASIAQGGGIPREYALRQNYPNPFNPSTTIRFELPQTSRVTLKVYNVLGQEVRTLVDEEKPAGVYDVPFNGVDLSSGMYIYRLRASDYGAALKLMLVK